jgi:hypothetical protein
MELVLVDEYSMIFLGWIAEISAALEETVQCRGKPFRRVLVVWIGDMHQL